jgi:hypothetical protein
VPLLSVVVVLTTWAGTLIASARATSARLTSVAREGQGDTYPITPKHLAMAFRSKRPRYQAFPPTAQKPHRLGIRRSGPQRSGVRPHYACFADSKPRIRTHQTARQILAKSRLEVVLRQQSR